MFSPIKVSGIYKTNMAMNNQSSKHRLDKYDSKSANDQHGKQPSKFFKDVLKSELAKNNKCG